MLELYQAEWCRHSHRVRQLLTELRLDFIAHQIPADRAERDEMRAAVDHDSIPVLVHGDAVFSGEDAIVAHLLDSFPEAADAEKHRLRDREEGPSSWPALS